VKEKFRGGLTFRGRSLGRLQKFKTAEFYLILTMPAVFLLAKFRQKNLKLKKKEKDFEGFQSLAKSDQEKKRLKFATFIYMYIYIYLV